MGSLRVVVLPVYTAGVNISFLRSESCACDCPVWGRREENTTDVQVNPCYSPTGQPMLFPQQKITYFSSSKPDRNITRNGSFLSWNRIRHTATAHNQERELISATFTKQLWNNKGIKLALEDVIRTQQQRPESPTHARHARHIYSIWESERGCTFGGAYVSCIYLHFRQFRFLLFMWRVSSAK